MRARGASEVDEVESARREDHERIACGSASAVWNQEPSSRPPRTLRLGKRQGAFHPRLFKSPWARVLRAVGAPARGVPALQGPVLAGPAGAQAARRSLPLGCVLFVSCLPPTDLNAQSLTTVPIPPNSGDDGHDGPAFGLGLADVGRRAGPVGSGAPPDGFRGCQPRCVSLSRRRARRRARARPVF